MAIRLLVGSGGLIGALQKAIPSKYWKIAPDDNPRSVIDALIAHKEHASNGTVFTNASANWSQARKEGWRIVWCGDLDKAPIGTLSLPVEVQDMTISEFAKRSWNVSINDRRTVADVITGKVKTVAPVLYVTGGSGGLSKTVTARRLAERASAMKVPTLLVDANSSQSSQWSYFGEVPDTRCIADWNDGEKVTEGANRGRRFGINYDLCFAPPMGVHVSWQRYRDYIHKASRLWGFVVVDLDHITGSGITNSESADGALLAPSVRGGDLCLFIIRAGIQTEADGIKVLGPMLESGMPKENIAIKLVMPEGTEANDIHEYENMFKEYGTFIGVDTFTSQASKHLMKGDNNWPDKKLDYTREMVLKWALPNAGFDPSLFVQDPVKKRFFR